jgi:hypothetical protein
MYGTALEPNPAGVLGHPITIEIALALGYLAPRIDFDVST